MSNELPAPAPADSPPVIVVGASFGGVEALTRLAGALPADFPAIVGIVLHVGAQPSILPELLSRSGPLRAVHPGDGETLQRGTLYVAPPDHHLLFVDGRANLWRGPRENLSRPAIDPLFRSVALGWGPRAIGVVLTGHMDDGTAGLDAIKSCGGIAIVQDPVEAPAAGMPASALSHVEVDHCLPLDMIGPLLVRLAGLPPRGGIGPPPPTLVQEQALSTGEPNMDDLSAIADPTQLTCPDCGGTLSELRDSRPLRYRCHTGHAYTALSLRAAQVDLAAHALQGSLRALREREALLRRLAVVAEKIGDADQARAGLGEADRVRRQAQDLVRIIDAEPGGA
jgi:two-component system chemotaxis response regulator CheB